MVDSILTLTNCHPYLLQLLGSAIVTEANERQTHVATQEILEAAILRAFTLGEPYFKNVWTEFTGNPRNGSEVKAGQNFLKALTNEADLDNSSLSQSALQRMLRYHVLKSHDHHYQFEVPLLERWVRERAI